MSPNGYAQNLATCTDEALPNARRLLTRLGYSHRDFCLARLCTVDIYDCVIKRSCSDKVFLWRKGKGISAESDFALRALWLCELQ